jgi:hypothetical protein
MKHLISIGLLACVIGGGVCGGQEKDQTVTGGIGGFQYPCNGMVKRLPVDLLGREYRGQCVDGIEIWSWANTASARFPPAENTVFIIAVNRRPELASIVRDDFYVVSIDPKHPQDANRAKVTQAIDPSAIAAGLTRLGLPSPYHQQPPRELYSNIYDANGKYVGQMVSTDPLWPLVSAIQQQEQKQINDDNAQAVSTMAAWVTRTGYAGGAISSGGSLGGYLYFGKIKGSQPMLMYNPKAQAGTSKYISIPLGNWPIDTGLAPQ